MTIFVDKFCQPDHIAGRARVECQYGFLPGLQSGELKGDDVLSFCKKLRECCSHHGRKARDVLGADSPDFIQVAGWLKYMAQWANTAEAAGKNLQLSPDSPTDMVNAATYMGLLQAYNQTLGVALPSEQEGTV